MKYQITFLLLTVILTYIRSLSIYFSGDDWVFLYGALKGLNLPYIFRFIPGSFAPIINLSFLVLYNIFHLNQIGYHIAAISIHFLNCILFFYIINEITQNKNLAFVSAFLFSVFSPYNQIVIWISGLAGLITSTFFLSSFYNFILYRKKNKIPCLIFSMVSFILSILCKEWAVVVFVLYILYDLVFHYKNKRRGVLIKAYIPFIIILAVYLPAEFLLPYPGKRDMLGPHIFFNLSTYLSTFIIPSRNISQFPLKIFIPILDLLLPMSIRCISVFFPLISLIVVIRGPALIRFYILWIYITLLPFLFFPWGTASRYYYIPSMGFIGIFSYLFLYVMDILKARTGKIVLCLCLGIFTAMHISFIELRITKLYKRNREIQHILRQLKEMYPAFPSQSRLFFSGFSYSRKWSYAVRTIYKSPDLTVYRNLPSPGDLKDTSSPIFVFDYKNAILQDKTSQFF